jgi:hypothetical protein
MFAWAKRRPGRSSIETASAIAARVTEDMAAAHQ